jgi:hypothetical protein
MVICRGCHEEHRIPEELYWISHTCNARSSQFESVALISALGPFKVSHRNVDASPHHHTATEPDNISHI